MKIIAYTRPGEWHNRFHRTAYFDAIRRRDVTAIIGLHWLVRIGRRVWEWSFIYNESRLERLLNDAYCSGVTSRNKEVVELLDARDAAYDDGRKAGEAWGSK